MHDRCSAAADFHHPCRAWSDPCNSAARPMASGGSIDILGGTVRGPKLNGRILPGGADWQIVRSDGAADIQARYTIESDAARAFWSTARLAARPARGAGAAGARRQRRSRALLFPHRDAVRDRRSGERLAQPDSGAGARRARRAQSVRLESRGLVSLMDTAPLQRRNLTWIDSCRATSASLAAERQGDVAILRLNRAAEAQRARRRDRARASRRSSARRRTTSARCCSPAKASIFPPASISPS